MEKEDFLEAVKDYVFDNKEEMGDLKISDNAYVNSEGNWEVLAEDEKCTYTLTDIDCNIIINYIGAK